MQIKTHLYEDTNVKHVNSEENAFSEEVNTSDENATKKTIILNIKCHKL